MKSATLVMSGENTATLSVTAPLHTQILDETRSTDSDSTVIKELRSAMQDNLKLRSSKNLTVLVMEAVHLYRSKN
ncbi:zinc finger BED domain-containing 1-like protein [Labeo rohita]|uniref:Zinc finger BED domain-containing 1-like protein n=1 Tax=Labeo rohita TaxID=84645 RepID=A0A498P2X3_LABRO|nr:zinc finger BED domain-containing 1-like protein [Labeo rohita]RXN38266.1 zinc finger BED domain-containing 1-like protein [Labeo rohita]